MSFRKILDASIIVGCWTKGSFPDFASEFRRKIRKQGKNHCRHDDVVAEFELAVIIGLVGVKTDAYEERSWVNDER